MFQVLVLIATTVFIYYYVWSPFTYWKHRNVPYITSVPLLGSFANVVLTRVSLADNVLQLYRGNPNCSVVGLFQFFSPLLMIRDPNIIKQITINDFDHFSDHGENVFIEKIDPILGKILFALKGQRWRNMRSTLSPAFTGKKLRNMFEIIAECGEQFVDYCTELFEKSQFDTLEFEFKDLFTRFTNDVIATTAFGFKCDSFRDKENVFFQMGQVATDFQCWKIALMNIAPNLMKVFNLHLIPDETVKYFGNLIHENLKKREEESIYRPDVLNLILEARKEQLNHNDHNFDKQNEIMTDKFKNFESKKTDQIELTDDIVTAQAFQFFFAGFETISTVLSFTVYELALNSDIQKRLQKEVDNVEGEITYEKINGMKYLDMIILETLRKWPPVVMTDRVCTKPYTLKVDNLTLKLQPGSLINIPIYGIHHDPNFYNNPEKYDPERFSDENKSKIRPEIYLSFGIGQRNCIGGRFTLLELKIVLYFLFKSFDVIVTKNTSIPLLIKKKSLNINAENGFWLGLRKRR